MSIQIIFAALLASLFLVPQVHAANVQWTTVASACVPDESSAGRYVADGATVQFAAAQTGAPCSIAICLLRDQPIPMRLPMLSISPTPRNSLKSA
jgi:hypothetical protein